jgi:hypothetical protein
MKNQGDENDGKLDQDGEWTDDCSLYRANENGTL